MREGKISQAIFERSVYRPLKSAGSLSGEMGYGKDTVSSAGGRIVRSSAASVIGTTPLEENKDPVIGGVAPAGVNKGPVIGDKAPAEVSGSGSKGTGGCACMSYPSAEMVFADSVNRLGAAENIHAMICLTFPGQEEEGEIRKLVQSIGAKAFEAGVGIDQVNVNISENVTAPVMSCFTEGNQGRPEPGAEPEGEIRPEPGAEPEGEIRPEPGAEPEPGSKPEPGAEPEGEIRPEPGAEPERGTEPESGSRPERGAEAECGAGPERGAEPAKAAKAGQTTTQARRRDSRAGSDVLMIGSAGLAGTAILAAAYRERLAGRLPEEIIRAAVGMGRDLLTVQIAHAVIDSVSGYPDAYGPSEGMVSGENSGIVPAGSDAGKQIPNAAVRKISAMTDGAGAAVPYFKAIGEGGVFAALWEMCEALSCGLEADIHKIPVRQETVEICEILDRNPYWLYGTGALLAVVRNGEAVRERLLSGYGIRAELIGTLTDETGRYIHNREVTRCLEKPRQDALFLIG